MELRYVLITLLKILISTPTVLLLYDLPGTNSAALMGGHLDNKKGNSSNVTDTYYEYDIVDSQELEEKDDFSEKERADSEEIPDPSPLVLPGYNLPENIFNHGKPFYVEKDPLTGKIDFSHKSPSYKADEEYDYVDEEPSDSIYDKANIDRKDGGLSSHKPSDVNQLTPNFHDFLNLPVKYNPEKYVYPLISSSYASTKIQGSVNKLHNHKDYNTKYTTKKPLVSPTYYSTNNQYFNPTKTTPKIMSISTVTTTQKPSTTKRYPEIYLTTETSNLMESGMSHPSFGEEFDYYDASTSTTEKPKPSDIYLTTESVKTIFLTSTKPPTTTTKKIMSLFEQLFGDFEETVTTTQKAKPPVVFNNLTSDEYKHKNEEIVKTEKPSYSTLPSTTLYTHYPNAHAGPNILTGSSMGLDNAYDYEDYGTDKYEDNVAVESKPVGNIDDELKIEPLDVFKEEKVTLNISGTMNSSNTNTAIKQHNNTDYSEYNYKEKDTTITTTTSTTTTTTLAPTTSTRMTITTTPMATVRVTSLPLGENHVTNSNYEPFNHEPIIVATQNLREKLNSEKVLPRPFEKPVHTQPPSTSNIHIAPDQDMVSFVVGNQQHVDGGQYVGTSLKESPYESNPFRPLYGQGTYKDRDSLSFSVQVEPVATSQSQPSPPHLIQSYPEIVGSAVTIQPLRNSEASLAIGVPVNSMKQIPGQVVDDELEIDDNPVEPPTSTGAKIIFPDAKEPEFPDLMPPPRRPQPLQPPPPNREVLKLSSKPVYHQLPSDLTPPKQKEVASPPILDHRPVRPQWGGPTHFYNGKPEYNRPLRPPPESAYKRIDNLPNILPQFRPNMNKRNPSVGHFYDNKLLRQPLLERPSNRPIGFFEKLQPPPPPPFAAYKNLQHLRKIPPPALPPRQSLDDTKTAEDRIINDGPRKPAQTQDQYVFFQTPPPVKIPNRRSGEDTAEVETLQMIQAKNADKVETTNKEYSTLTPQIVNIPAEDTFKDNTEKTIYKVYPVNTPPIKLDVLDNDKKESVVIGTRAELPLPPSKINKDFVYDQNPLFDTKDRNDAPILKPHPRPSTFPIKSDFPYPLERPDPSVNHPAVPETPSGSGNDLDEIHNKYVDEPSYFVSNQWNTNVESRIVNRQKANSPNQISVTLKTFTDKPIAVAYTPTEPNLNADKYSMPNYGSPVIPEIRPGTVENAETGHGNANSEFTVSAVMHTHPQVDLGNMKNIANEADKRMDELKHNNYNHKSDMDAPSYPKLDFQAPFQASVNLDQTINQGWAVVREKNKTTTETNAELTTMPYATTSEFDIENFKPQLEGGFKPIYSFPENDKKVNPDIKVSEREE